jgi:hypothetical protein
VLDQYQEAQKKAEAQGKQLNFDPQVLQAQSAISNWSPMGVVFVSSWGGGGGWRRGPGWALAARAAAGPRAVQRAARARGALRSMGTPPPPPPEAHPPLCAPNYPQWISIVNNIFAVCGLAGVLSAQRELVVAFFSWSAVQLVCV